MTSTKKIQNMYEGIERLKERQIKDLVRMYENEWWTKGRERGDVERMLESTDLIVAFCERASRKLVAFSRVLTDTRYKAIVFDVIVDPAARGKGLGRALMKGIIRHPKLKNVRHIELYCKPQMIPFYEQFGFSAQLPEVRYMRYVRPVR